MVWQTNDLGLLSPCAVARALFRQVVHRILSRAKRLSPRNVKSVETLVHLWRKVDVSIGCPIALLNLQSASRRKQVISGYHYSWWVSRNHRDAMTRYSLIIASIVSMNNDQINKKDEGSEEHWKSALISYHQKWDVSGILPSISTLIEKLRKKE
jgi:hypothetical protein